MDYINPIYPSYFADPFVLRHDGTYYAYGTAPGSPHGAQFPILTSPDLVHWTQAGFALLEAPGIEFWAPEVAYADGQFYLYYSARGVTADRDHQLRVAVSSSPLGAFRDAGRVLVAEQPFSIDPHPYRHTDGQWYLYYSRDFLTPEELYRVGTGIVVDRMKDMLTLEGTPRLVARPFADWHLFKEQRAMYGGIYDWHTIEGASVLLHNDKIYCFYSGGAWEKENYGISYVVSDHPLNAYHPPSDSSAPLMKTVPGQVIGPGHNSFVLAPDNQTMMCVYHGWDVDRLSRLMRIDPLYWDGDIPRIQGPTWTPQRIP